MAPRYTNLDGSTIDKGLGDLLKWKLGPSEVKRAKVPAKPTPIVLNDGRLLLGAPRPALTFVGHATWLAQLGGRSFIVDPIYAKRLYVVKRHAPPGVAMVDLPVLDAVLVTHNHHDHMDMTTLEALSKRARLAGGEPPVYIVPKGVGPTIASAKIGRAIELGWWEHTDVGDVRVTFVPSQHWSQRGALDRNKTWWGGYVLECGGVRVYHSGDTAYFEGFRLIGQKLGRIDAAMLPIGAYEPRWFMRPQHMNPDDAVQAFLDLGAERFLAMHWGTFSLTDEPLDEPPVALAEVLARRNLADPRVFQVPAIGETVFLDGTSQRGETRSLDGKASR